LIRYHNAHGNRAAALEEYERLESYLGTHHGIAPADRVREAVEAVRRDDIDEMSAPLSERRGAGKPAPQPAKARARLLRIAVAPFSSENETDGHLVDGFRSELLANLARFREWTVVEVDEDVHDAETTREDPVRSHCHYLVNGEYVTVEGQQVLRMTLSDLRSTRVVWRDDIVVDLYAWSSRQREVIGRIAAHLETYISADRLANTIGDSGYDSTSYDDWLRSERIFARWDPEAAVEAEHILERVIERDAEFAPAYSSLASFHNVQHVIRPGMPRDAEDGHKASRLAERSVELDPLDARNHLAVAWTASLNGAFDRAAIHLDLASTLNQNCPTTLVSCAMGYAFIGQIERAEALVGHVLRISPLLSDYQWCYIASVHFLAGRYEDALKAEEQSGDRIVDNPGWTAATLVQLGRQDDARQAFQSLVEAVRPIWAGETEPTAETVLDWFIGAYPLRNDADRQLLSESLKAAIGDDENR
jgi:TolB-like protein